eukprot:515425-Amphidinium_carterae.1
MERMVCDPGLPYAPALCSFYLPPGKELRVHARDLKDFYFQLGVPRERYVLQQLGPRVPRDWFDEISGDPPESLSTWFWPDLKPRNDPVHPECPHRWCQPCVTAVMMGDINGVSVAQRAHVHMLESAQLLPEDLRLKRGSVRWGRSEMSDVYIDDFCCLASRDKADHSERWDDRRVRAVDDMYESHQVAQSSHKAVNREPRGKIWGAEVDGLEGTVGVPHDRRVSLFCIGLLWLTLPAAKGVAESLLGCMTGSF